MTQSNGQPKNYKLVDDYNGRWENNKAFQYAVKNGRDKAFSSLSDYVKKRDATQEHYRKLRKDNPVAHGERKKLSFELAGAWQRFQPAMYIVFFIGLIWWALATGQFASKERTTLDVFGQGHRTSYVFLPVILDGEEKPTAKPQGFNYGVLATPISFIIFAYYLRRWLKARRRKPAEKQDKKGGRMDNVIRTITRLIVGDLYRFIRRLITGGQ